MNRRFPLRTWATIVDWDDLESTTTLAWNQLSDDEAVEWAMTTTAGQCSLGLLLYDGEQPCLVGPLAFMVRHLDELVWGAPGSRILFGVNRDDDGQILFTNGLIEFNGKGELFGNCRKPITHYDRQRNLNGDDYDDTLNFAKNTARKRLFLAFLISFLSVVVRE